MRLMIPMTALMAGAASAATPSHQSSGPLSVQVDGLLALRQTTTGRADIGVPRWIETPDLQKLETGYADTLPQAFQASLKCKAKSDGKLSACTVQSLDPERPEFRSLALSLSSEVRMDPAQVREFKGRLEWIGLNLDVRNENGVKMALPPCLFNCAITPPPPPPR